MQNKAVRARARWRTAVAVASASILAAMLAPGAAGEESWDRGAAARYLDARASLWSESSKARQKLATACLSCHTAVPYLLSRAALGGTSAPAPAEELFSDVETRVTGWSDARVWYEESVGPDKPAQSRATESVLNALVLAARDRRARRPLSEEAETALAHMWAQQNAGGNWEWLHFGLSPWETDGSEYWGAGLAAVASMSVADEVRPPPEASGKLRSYLRAGMAAGLNLHNRLALLWAASTWDGLLSPAETSRLVGDVLAGQQPDGGFRLEASGAKSDGYASAFATYVLQRIGDPRADEGAARGIEWLVRHQQADGRWDAASPNKDRSDDQPFTRLLMSDAATGFAILALTSPETGPPRSTEP